MDAVKPFGCRRSFASKVIEYAFGGLLRASYCNHLFTMPPSGLIRWIGSIRNRSWARDAINPSPRAARSSSEPSAGYQCLHRFDQRKSALGPSQISEDD